MENNPEQLTPAHIAALEEVRVLVRQAEKGELLRDAIMHATSLVEMHAPVAQFEVISELAEHASRLHTWTEYKPDHEYNSSAGVACEVLAAGLQLPEVVADTQNRIKLHYKRMLALTKYEQDLPVGSRRLGHSFYPTVVDIDCQRRGHAREIIRMTEAQGHMGSYHSFYRAEALLNLGKTQDLVPNPTYL